MWAVLVVEVGAALVIGVVALNWLRRVRRRLESAVARLADDGDGLDAGGRFERTLGRLERAAERTTVRMDAVQSDASRALRSLAALPEGVVIVDERGHEVFRNEVADAFADARHAEVLVEHAIQEALRAAVDGDAQRRNLDILGPPRRMLSIATIPLDDGARPIGAVAIIDDISERRRLEAVRRDFVANISHELKTPVGALGVLAETIASEDDRAVTRRLASRMTDEALRVGRIIDDLLALSRIEAEEQPLREPVQVSAVVSAAVEHVRTLAEASDIKLDESGVGRRHTVRGDRRQLNSAVANLLENACKYSDPGSTVYISSVAGGKWIEISVRDEGIGIPASDLERVFERFYRVDRARSRETGGTGLGLAIVRHVAGNHRGDVRVESREGEGSTFTLRLPSGPGPVAVSDPTREGEAASA